LCLFADDTIYARAAGFDPAFTGRAFEYFNLAYYELMRFAIEHGFARLDYGMGAYRAKLQRGARLEPLWGLAVNRAGASVTDDERFRSWDSRRCAALAARDRDALDGPEALP
jgi:hypothetical protein